MKSADELWREIEQHEVRNGTITFWWLYQAGLVLKSPGGTVIAIDPYLSDAVMQSYKVPRNVPAPLDPATAHFDAVLASHSHEDHLDPGSITAFASHPATRFVGPPMASAKVVAKGVPADRTVSLTRGDRTTIGDFDVRAVHARHMFAPEPTPDAIGFVVGVGGVTVHHSGDTEYDSEIVADTLDVSASFIVMNGTAGNMNVHEAALLAWQNRARVAIPFHYGLWADAGYGEGATLDPAMFVETYRRLAPDGHALVLEAGRAVVLDASGTVG